MTRRRRYSVQAWWTFDGRIYTCGPDGEPVGFMSENDRAVIDVWRQIRDDTASTGVPSDADFAVLEAVKVEEQTAEGRWFEMTKVDPPAPRVVLWDRRPVPETDFRGMVEAHIASLHQERAA